MTGQALDLRVANASEVGHSPVAQSKHKFLRVKGSVFTKGVNSSVISLGDGLGRPESTTTELLAYIAVQVLGNTVIGEGLVVDVAVLRPHAVDDVAIAIGFAKASEKYSWLVCPRCIGIGEAELLSHLERLLGPFLSAVERDRLGDLLADTPWVVNLAVPRLAVD